MKRFELDGEYKVYFSSNHRMVKKLDDLKYEAYVVTIVDKEKMLTVNTLNFKEIKEEAIHSHLSNCGLIYQKDEQKIVQKHDESIVVEDDPERIYFIIADKMTMSGYYEDSITYPFERMGELNDMLIDLDVPLAFAEMIIDSF